MHGRWLILLVALTCAGCGFLTVPPPRQDDVDSSLADLGRDFDPDTAGSISGKVQWVGEVPIVPPFHAKVTPRDYLCRDWRDWPHPYAPRIDPDTRGVAKAVIYLEGVDPARSRPWDHPEVKVVVEEYQFRVDQGTVSGGVGIHRRGKALEMVSRLPVFDSIVARGSTFFSLPFPDPDKPQSRFLHHRGVVELSSGGSRFWERAYVFVDDHPYYARSDAQGRFTLDRVPAGRYRIVCWLPNWHKSDHVRNADTGEICEVFFQPPTRIEREVVVEPGARTPVELRLSQEDFPPDR
jgi:hypothetical protein